MVKNDSLYVIAIVAVVAVVGLVVMATTSSTVMEAENLPNMVEESDSTAIAGQAYMKPGLDRYQKTSNLEKELKYRKTDKSNLLKTEELDQFQIMQVMDLLNKGAINLGGVYVLVDSLDLRGSRLEGNGDELCKAINGQVHAYIDLYNPSNKAVTYQGIITSDYFHNSNDLGWSTSYNIAPPRTISAQGMYRESTSVNLERSLVDCQYSSYSLCNQDAFNALNMIYANQYIDLSYHYTISLNVDGQTFTHSGVFTDIARKTDWSGSTSNDNC